MIQTGDIVHTLIDIPDVVNIGAHGVVYVGPAVCVQVRSSTSCPSGKFWLTEEEFAIYQKEGILVKDPVPLAGTACVISEDENFIVSHPNYPGIQTVGLSFEMAFNLLRIEANRRSYQPKPNPEPTDAEPTPEEARELFAGMIETLPKRRGRPRKERTS